MNFKPSLIALFLSVGFVNTTFSATQQNLTEESITIVKADDPRTQYPYADQFVQVEFGPYKVKVPKGGYYDRFRMNPDLNEVAKDPLVGNIDFFRKIPKQLVDTRVGKVWSPNFYYTSSNVQVLMLAPLSKIKAKLPSKLQPLSPVPGYGLVSLTFFDYDVADADPYDEVSVAVVTHGPDSIGSNTLELVNSIYNRTYYAHVLALPVDTEIARVRGVYGYNLPKWLTAINMKINDRVTANIYDTSGNLDVSLSAPTPKLETPANESNIETRKLLNQVDGKWYSSLIQTNNQQFGQQFFPLGVKITRNTGPVSKLLNELGAEKVVRLDVIKQGQIALHMPKPVDAWN
ncbi:acetoacetate decarboxylase [Acinetobacter sp. XH1639]|uniref:acetoacetate decarboxylase n=1 Tax=Acinetobacter sp. XH1639 TaxID=3157368 RepID=UPI0032B5227A